MGRSYSHLFNLGSVYSVNAVGPLDNRIVVDAVSDLTSENTWKVGSNLYIYKGLVVSVKNTGQLYMFTGNATKTDIENSSNWKEIASASDSGLSVSQITGGGGYTITQGSNSFNILFPQDIFVNKGEVVDITANTVEKTAAVYYTQEEADEINATHASDSDWTPITTSDVKTPATYYEAGKYIKLTLQGENNYIYIKVDDLIEYITTPQQLDGPVTLTIDNNHQITASVSNISSNELDSTLSGTISGAVQDGSGSNYISTSKSGTTLNISTTTQTISEATSENNGLATANDVKQYVSGQISGNLVWENIDETPVS